MPIKFLAPLPGKFLFYHGVYANIKTKYFFDTSDICFDLNFFLYFFFGEKLAGTLGCMR